MNKPLKTLLASTILLLTAQHAAAEAPPFFNNFGMQAPPAPPVWDTRAPVLWADCIPVPEGVVNNMNVIGMPNQFAMPVPQMPMMNSGNGANTPLPVPPPSPFYNVPAPQAPMLFSMPTPAPVAPVNCDKSAKNELVKLQQHYDNASAASRKKINGMQQSLSDVQNQLADSRSIIESLSKDKNANSDKITGFATELKTIEEAKIKLQSQLKTQGDSSSEQSKLIVDLDNKNKLLQEKIRSLETNAGALKEKLAASDNANKSFKTKMGSLEANAGSQARKLTALGQSATQLTALQSAYKARSDENAALKAKLAEFDNANKSLTSKLGTLESNAGAQARKLTALGQSATELTALQSAYKARSDENAALKAKLAELEGSLKKSAGTVDTCNTEIIDLKGKLTALDGEKKSSLIALDTNAKELATLKKSCKELGAANDDLAKKLAAATADKDKDGILDHSDKCPFTTAGTTVNAMGCADDSDKDGVVDANDKCPTSPVGSHVNAEGCPKIKDADNDGVADASDLCPTSAIGSTVNEFGCEPTANITLDGVNFLTGSSSLTAESLPILDAAAATIVKNPSIQLEISGHTDNQGGSALNKNLSQRRANTVMIHLIKRGVEAGKLVSKGYGDQNPIADNATNAGRKTNRRVELKIRK